VSFSISPIIRIYDWDIYIISPYEFILRKVFIDNSLVLFKMSIIKGICEMCGGQLGEASRREVGGTIYVMMRCCKCNHMVARSCPK